MNLQLLHIRQPRFTQKQIEQEIISPMHILTAQLLNGKKTLEKILNLTSNGKHSENHWYHDISLSSLGINSDGGISKLLLHIIYNLVTCRENSKKLGYFEYVMLNDLAKIDEFVIYNDNPDTNHPFYCSLCLMEVVSKNFELYACRLASVTRYIFNDAYEHRNLVKWLDELYQNSHGNSGKNRPLPKEIIILICNFASRVNTPDDGIVSFQERKSGGIEKLCEPSRTSNFNVVTGRNTAEISKYEKLLISKLRGSANIQAAPAH